MNKIKRMFRIAKTIAKCGDAIEAKRNYRIGAVGLRTDGVIVASSNIVIREPDCKAHAEYRVCQKLNAGSIIYVVRINRSNKLTIARPCKNCQLVMKNNRIKRVYYSIDESEYGVIDF